VDGSGDDQRVTVQARRHGRRPGVFTVALTTCLFVAVAGVAFALSGGDTKSSGSGSSHWVPAPTPSVTVHQLRTYRWSELPAAPIGTRFGAVSVWTGNRMIVWGGRSGGSLRTDGASYAPAKRRWTRVPAAPLSPRKDADAVWTGSRLLIADGDDGHTQLTDGAMYDPSNNSWTRLAPAPSMHHGGPARFWVPVTMFWAGDRAVRLSLDKNFAATELQAVAFDPSSNAWTTLPSIKFAPVNNYTGVTGAMVGNRFVVWVSSEGSFVLGGDSWQRVDYAPGEAGCIYSVIPTPRSIIYPADWNSIACGGDLAYSAGTRGDTLDLRTGDVTRIPYTPTSDAGAIPVWTGGALLNAAARATDDRGVGVKRLRVAAGTTAAWAPGSSRWVPLRKAPAGGDSATWQWTGRQLIGYGSFGCAGSAISFGR
jgi:hypothetical protein